MKKAIKVLIAVLLGIGFVFTNRLTPQTGVICLQTYPYRCFTPTPPPSSTPIPGGICLQTYPYKCFNLPIIKK